MFLARTVTKPVILTYYWLVVKDKKTCTSLFGTGLIGRRATKCCLCPSIWLVCVAALSWPSARRCAEHQAGEEGAPYAT